MKTIFLFILSISFSSANAQSVIREKKILRYYKSVLDSINGVENLAYANEKATKIQSQKCKLGEILFKELATTNLKDITANAISVNKYIYTDNIETTTRHSIVTITYKTIEDAKLNYQKIIQAALEESGVPGLTDANDIIIINGKMLYWINSNCFYTLKKHIEFADTFLKELGLGKTEYIECDCGKVICKSIKVIRSH